MGLFFFALLTIIFGIMLLVFPQFLPLRKANPRLTGIIGIVVGGILLLSSMIVIIDAGEVGAVVIFGKVQEKTLINGIHFIPPYADIVKYPVRLQQVSLTGDKAVDIRVNNDLSISLDSTIYYYVDSSKAGEVYKFVAKSITQLQNDILIPIMRAEIRNIGSQYTAEEIYSGMRSNVTELMKVAISNKIVDKGVVLSDFLIRDVKLPEIVERTIQEKIQAKQKAQTMEYKIKQAEDEARIKIIEAEGLAKAQRIINSTLSPNYLQHEAIQAYRELANSENTTFVILPTSPNATGLPLILNGTK